MRQFMKLLVTSWDPNRSRPTHTYRPIYDFILLSLKIKGLSQVDGVGHIRFICWSFSYYVRKLGLHLHSLSLSLSLMHISEIACTPSGLYLLTILSSNLS
jgi:hypothetical protein